eukprot:TRINITY_DN13097_c0_g5_i2.p1 TRINITY_DN13097_c0_g5~~TRINITY_DN13097_c0_g5_i2.p1  ORF type:complete len:101 (+),score=0.73 TRINITY_DN13097_c0_g5_i2:807-1109(+)
MEARTRHGNIGVIQGNKFPLPGSISTSLCSRSELAIQYLILEFPGIVLFNLYFDPPNFIFDKSNELHCNVVFGIIHMYQNQVPRQRCPTTSICYTFSIQQ